MHLQPQLAHRNWRIREQVLYSIQRLQDIHGEGVRAAPSLIRLVADLLSDAQESIRQLATETLAGLHCVFKDTLMVRLLGLLSKLFKSLTHSFLFCCSEHTGSM